MFTMCNSEEKQLQHLNNISRSHVDYCMCLLMNHPLYFLHWVVLLISFISCPWFFFLFSVSCFACFSSCRFISFQKGRSGSSAWAPLETLKGLGEWVTLGILFVVSAHFKVFPWLLFTPKRCLWSNGPVTMLCYKLQHETSYLVNIDKFVGFLWKTSLKQNFSLSCLLLWHVPSQIWLSSWKPQVPKHISEIRAFVLVYLSLGSISRFNLFNWRESKGPSLCP